MTGKDFSDDEIVDLLFARDESALRALEKRYEKLIYALVYSILGSKEDSEECVNSVYQALWTAIPPERPASLKAYIVRLSQSIALNRYKSARRQKRVPSAMTESLDDFSEFLSDTGSVEETYENKELGVFLNEYVASLTEEQRCLFVKRYCFSQTIPQISAQTGLKKLYIKKQLEKIKTDLKHKLEERNFL